MGLHHCLRPEQHSPVRWQTGAVHLRWAVCTSVPHASLAPHPSLARRLLDVVLFTRSLSHVMGYRRQFALYGYYLLCAQLLRATSPPLAAMTAQETALAGAFRAAHQRLVAHAEEVAVSGRQRRLGRMPPGAVVTTPPQNFAKKQRLGAFTFCCLHTAPAFGNPPACLLHLNCSDNTFNPTHLPPCPRLPRSLTIRRRA